MYKLQPKYKICFSAKQKIHNNLNLKKLKKKKWFFLKRQLKKNKSYFINYDTKRIERKKYIFKQKLLTKQQFSYFYGIIPNYKLKNLSNKINNKKIITNNFENLIIYLESRLDIVLYRLEIVDSIFKIQQLINHKKIEVNNKIVNSKNYILKKGDFFIVKDPKFLMKPKKKLNYIEFNQKLNKGIFVRKPFFEELQYPFKFNYNYLKEFLQN